MSDDIDKIRDSVPSHGTVLETSYYTADSQRAMEDALTKLVVQQKWIRWCAIGLAIMVISLAVVVEYVLLCEIIRYGTPDIDNFVVLAITPIASITVITISVLFGAFSRGRNPVSSSAMQAVRNFAGGNGV